MSAASSSVQAGSTTRQVNFAALALLVAVAVLAMVAVGQFATSRQVTPGTVYAPVQHDRGWSSASSEAAGAALAVDPDSAATDAARHPSNRSISVTPDGIKVTGARGGGLLYNGIPYTGGGQPSDGSGGSTRARLAQ